MSYLLEGFTVSPSTYIWIWCHDLGLEYLCSPPRSTHTLSLGTRNCFFLSYNNKAHDNIKVSKVKASLSREIAVSHSPFSCFSFEFPAVNTQFLLLLLLWILFFLLLAADWLFWPQEYNLPYIFIFGQEDEGICNASGLVWTSIFYAMKSIKLLLFQLPNYWLRSCNHTIYKHAHAPFVSKCSLFKAFDSVSHLVCSNKSLFAIYFSIMLLLSVYFVSFSKSYGFIKHILQFIFL